MRKPLRSLGPFIRGTSSILRRDLPWYWRYKVWKSVFTVAAFFLGIMPALVVLGVVTGLNGFWGGWLMGPVAVGTAYVMWMDLAQNFILLNRGLLTAREARLYKASRHKQLYWSYERIMGGFEYLLIPALIILPGVMFLPDAAHPFLILIAAISLLFDTYMDLDVSFFRPAH